MTPELWVALAVAALPALGALVLGFVNRSAIGGIHVLINSRLSELVQAKETASRAEGVVQGNLDGAALTRLVQEAVRAALAEQAQSIAVATAAALLTDRARIVAAELETGTRS